MKPLALLPRIHRHILVLFLCSTPVFATTYYVDSLGGSDGNTGTSSGLPWQTLTRVNNGPLNNGGSYAAGSSILFKCGDTFSGQLAPLGSGTSSSPIILDNYGSGDFPVLSNPTTSMAFGQATINLRNVKGYVIRNLALTNPQGSGAVTISIDHTGTYGYFRLHNLLCYDLGTSNTTATVAERRNAAGIIFNNSLTSGGNFDDVQITNCTVWHGAGVGIQAFAKTVSDTVPTALRMTNSVIRNCVVHNFDNDGIVWRGADAALIDHCTVFDTGNLQDHAMVGLWIKQSTGSTIQYCESYLNTGNTTDSEGFDFDIDVDNSVLQYSYSHNNDGGMLLICANDASGNQDTGNIARYNVSYNDARAATTWWGRVRNTSLYNNTIYVGTGTSVTKVIKIAADYSGSATEQNLLQNNIVYSNVAEAFDTNATILWTYNTFYGSGLTTTPSGTGNAVQDPVFQTPAAGGIGLGSVLGFKLASTSPARGAGATISGSGTVDYLGWALPVSSPDQGAFQYNDGTTENTPATPGSVSAATRGAGHVLVSWAYSGAPVEGFLIQRQTGAGSFSTITAAGNGEATFVDAGTTTGTTYTYKLSATNSAGTSSTSSSVSVTSL